MNQFSEKVKELRNRKSWTQEENNAKIIPVASGNPT